MPGAFRVAESGAATYRIDLSLPAGTAGAVPPLGLSYHSQRGNGLLGVGWGLDGLSAITRCRQTSARDGMAQPLTFTAADRFCLDGERLLLVNGSATRRYGAPDTRYRTEVDGFFTVTAKGGSGGQPDYFEVTRKDGSVATYGARGDHASEHRVYNLAGNSASQHILTWALREVKDSVGNRVFYGHARDAHGQRLSSINYAYGDPGVAGSRSRARVEFRYEARDDDTLGYLAGYRLQNTQRLVRITVRGMGTGTTTPSSLPVLRTYRLRYQGTTTHVLSRLAGVKECVGTSTTVCLPETGFEWSAPASLFKSAAGATLTLNTERSWAPVDFTPADLDGDGVTDWVWTETRGDRHRIRYALANKATGALTASHFTNNQSTLNYNNDAYGTSGYGDNLRVHTVALDYNADGRMDLAVYSTRSNQTRVHLSRPQAGGGWRLDSTGVLLFNGRYRYADLDSDGLLDAYRLVAVHGENALAPTGYNLEVRYLKRAAGQALTSARYYAYGPAVTLPVTFTPSASQDSTYLQWKHLALADVALADVDGDGRADLVAWGYDVWPHFDIGVSSVSTLRRLEVFRQTDTGFVRYGAPAGIPLASTGVSPKGVRVVDLNQDGLSDLVYFVGRWYAKSGGNYQWTGDWQYRLSTGAGFTAAQTLLAAASSGAQATSSPSLYDDNGDGYPDFLYHDVPNRQLRVRRWSAARGAFETGAPTRVRTTLGQDNEQYFVADLSGDGNGDLLRISVSGHTETLRVYRHNQAGRAHLMTSVSNGLGAETDITYESLSTTAAYVRVEALHAPVAAGSTPGERRCFRGFGARQHCWPVQSTLADAAAFYTALNAPWADPADPLTDPVTATAGSAPVLELTGPLYVVTRVDSSAPTGSDAGAKSGVGYVYERGKVQAAGRGLLGFRALTTVDLQTGVRTRTRYQQDFPYLGVPLRTEVRTAAGQLLRVARNTWRLKGYRAAWNARTGAGEHAASGSARLGPLQPYLAQTTEKTYDLPRTVAARVQSGALLTTVTTTTEVDAYGNPTRITAATQDHANDKRFRQQTVNTYGAAAATWEKEFGRLTQSVVTRQRDEADDGTYETSGRRSASFSYYTSGHRKGLLHTEVRDAVRDGRTVLIPAHTTTYDYDRFGNRVRAKVQAASGAAASSALATRCDHDTLEYDSYGRFVVQERDCANRVVRRMSTYNHHGLPAWSERVINDPPRRAVRTTYSYTAGGRQYFSRTADGSWTGTVWRACGGAVSCPQAGYHVETRHAGGGRERVYRDVLGRTMRTRARGFGGAWVLTDTEYDRLGRVKRRSEPFYPGETRRWSGYTYDLLGRVVRTELPDYVADRVNSVVTVAYAGRVTTTTNGKGQRQVVTRNALDEVIRTADHAGTPVTHGYDAWGQVTSTTTGTGDGAVTRRVTYDGRGRRTGMTDPDQGTWTYAYNGFDELVKQTDAAGNYQVVRYDALGRMQTRQGYAPDGTDADTDAELVSSVTWRYDPTNGRGQLASVTDTVSGYLRTVSYDTLGRVSVASTDPGTDDTYYDKQTYDGYGRVYQVFDATRTSASWTDNVVAVQYNAWGHAYKWVDGVRINGAPRRTYREITAQDARGQVTGETLGGGAVRTRRTFDASTGRIGSVTGQDALRRTLQGLTWEWDLVGNLTERSEGSAGKSLTETFTYDTLNRLTQAQVAGESARRVSYDALGNITGKTGVGSYRYGAGSAGPHAVTQAGSHTYTYDANGNMTQERRTGSVTRTLSYTAFNQVKSITRGTHTTTFVYDPAQSRVRRTDVVRTGSGTSTTTTLYLGGAEKVIAPDGSYTYKRYVSPGVLIEQAHDSSGSRTSEDVRYLLYDHLGSLDVVTDAAGTVVQDLSFDAWGQRRAPNDWTTLALLRQIDTTHGRYTTRGFTGHEMLDAVGIIHMNGRIYDPKLARFLQADPVIQFPHHAQSYNRYSYVLNNPLAYTDPSGHLVFSLFATALATILALESAGLVVIAAVIGSGVFADALVQGASVGEAFLAGVSAAALAYVGGRTFPLEGFGWNAETWVHLATVSTVGGITSSLQGGRFGHGFVAAGLGAATGGIPGLRGTAPRQVFARAVVSAVTGGTISAVTGGKFANGAAYGAFASLVSSAAQAMSTTKLNLNEMSDQELVDWIIENQNRLGIDIPKGTAINVMDHGVMVDEIFGKVACEGPCTITSPTDRDKPHIIEGNFDQSTNTIELYQNAFTSETNFEVTLLSPNGSTGVVLFREITKAEHIVFTMGHEAAHARGIDLRPGIKEVHRRANFYGHEALLNFRNIMRK